MLNCLVFIWYLLFNVDCKNDWSVESIKTNWSKATNPLVTQMSNLEACWSSRTRVDDLTRWITY